MQRRRFIGTALGGIIAGQSAPVWAETALAKVPHDAGTAKHPAKINARAHAIQSELASIERGMDGRLGVAIQDLETGLQAGHRTGDRFPMCSRVPIAVSWTANVVLSSAPTVCSNTRRSRGAMSAGPG